MSEWNVPAWRDPVQYGDRSLQQWARKFLGVKRDNPKFRMRQWAWEFLRRNPEYRALWRACIEPFCDPASPSQNDGLVGLAHCVPATQQAVLVRHFGLESFPPSPNNNYPPLFTGTGLRWTEEREARMLLYPGQIAVIFDLTRPLSRQMAAAAKLFTEAKKRGKHRGHRNRTDHFPFYLRVLDGVDAGVKHTEIGAVLFENQSIDQLSAVHDYLRAAKRLRDKDYLFIAAGAAIPAPAKKRSPATALIPAPTGK